MIQPDEMLCGQPTIQWVQPVCPHKVSHRNDESDSIW